MFLVPLHPLKNIDITNYFTFESSFNGTISRINSPKIKDEVYITHLDDKNRKGFH